MCLLSSAQMSFFYLDEINYRFIAQWLDEPWHNQPLKNNKGMHGHTVSMCCFTKHTCDFVLNVLPVKFILDLRCVNDH